MSGSGSGEGALAHHEPIWHDVECGGYAADLPLWEELAQAAAGPVLELGSGTGRVALPLAAAGCEVTALDSSPALLEELTRRAASVGSTVDVMLADARELSADAGFALIIAPMQFAHLLDGEEGRTAVFERAFAALVPGGRFALAVLGDDAPTANVDGPMLPDVREVDGWVYSSLPVEVRRYEGGLELRRLRQLVSPAGDLTEQLDSIHLDEIDSNTLEAEAVAAGFSVAERITIAPTDDHVGSTVLIVERPRR